MIKENKAISLVSLVVIIAVMLLISSITISVSYDRFEINNLNKMLNDLEFLRDKVSNYYLRYDVLPLVRNQANEPIKYSYKALEFDPSANDNENYYIIDLKAMDGMSLNYGLEGFYNPNTSDDVYIINEQSHNIYYPRGIEWDGDKYYSIADNERISDTIPPSKPEIKIISGEQNEEGIYTTAVSIEFVPGKDSASGIEKTAYSINDETEKDISTLANNILRISDNGTYNIKVRSYDKGNNVSEYVEIDINVENEENRKYRFITKWNVTLGETEGSETYSTVVLPVDTSLPYDAKIYWGDGTSTLLQHKTNGVTLTSAELTQKVTHNYELAENDNAERTIEIEGTYTSFNVENTGTTKLKLIGLEQWGNTGLTSPYFRGASNLSGIIPKNDLIELNCRDYCFAETNITGFEEGFYFSGGSFVQAFRSCGNLRTLPNSFKIPEGTTSLADMFRWCSSLEKLPDNFEIPDSVTSLVETFYQCSSLKEIPESFKIPENVTSVYSLFAGCSSLEKIPSDFSLPKGITGIGVASLFSGCGKLTEIPDDFVLPDGITSIQGTFMGLGIKRLPNDFKIPYGVTNMNNAFNSCAIEEFPENFEIPETVTNMNNAFRYGGNLKGTIIIKANPTDYTACFGYGTSVSSGSTLTVNYSKNCTNIDDILATGDSRYVVKGSLIDEEETTN